jgi:cytosine/creatinine deaminase
MHFIQPFRTKKVLSQCEPISPLLCCAIGGRRIIVTSFWSEPAMPSPTLDFSAMLQVALAEARKGLAEGGIPIGAAIFNPNGTLLGSGHNRRVQNGDPSAHGETDAFRNAGRQRSYRNLIMVTTLAPCWYCSGLIRQFGFGTVVVGESRNFQGGIDWLRSFGINVIDLDSGECTSMLASYIRANPEIWNEDIGVE